MSKEKCARCGDVDYDRRTLWMACFYEMNELGIPFESAMLKELTNVEIGGNGQHFYTLRVCKGCRGSWMAAIKQWFESYAPPAESPGTGIFVRKLGQVVEISEEEWRRDYSTKEQP